MKVKNTRLALLSCAAFLVLPSQATLLVSEDFSYADGGLSGQNGGAGFSGAWTSSTNVTGGVVTGNSPSSRSLSTPFPSSGTIWISFDWGNSTKPSENGSYGGLTFFIGGGEKFLIGNTWPGAGHDVWQMNSAPQTSVPNYPSMQTAVAKITLGEGAGSNVELWVGPVGSPVDVSGPPLSTVTGRELAGVDGLRINGADFGGSGNAQSFDNLLIGTTVSDVDATDAPPPPTTATWTNLASGQWDTVSNWLDDTVGTGGGNTANFNTLNITEDVTVNLDSARTIGHLVFGDIDASSAASWILTNNSVAGNLLTLSGTTPSITVNALGSNKTVSISAALAGTSGLTKAGAGTLTLAGANTYSGATIISNGTLQISGQPFFHVGRTTTVASGAVLELHNSNNTFATLMPTSSIAGAGTFRLTGNTTINQDLLGVSGNRLTFAMDAGALIDLQDSARLTNGGWQQMNWANNFAGMNIASGATFDVWDGQDVIIDALTGPGTVDKLHGGNSPRLLKVGIADGSGTFSGTIQNTGGQITFSKVGTGTQTLSGINTFTGNTNVLDGGLIIASSGSLRFRPTSNGQTNSVSGSSSSALTYLGEVDFDLSAANTTDGNFWSIVDVTSFAGEAPILTPAAVTSTLGDFTETSEGTWELALSTAKWVFTEADGILAYEVTATDYQLWASSYGLADGSESLDADGDGLSNFAEYAFGLIPNSGASVNAIPVSLDKTTGHFSYMRRDPNLPETAITYSIWYSTDLINWVEDTGAVEGIPTLQGNVDTVPVTISSSLLSNPKLFIQVRAN